jgi:hypothetical protein
MALITIADKPTISASISLNKVLKDLEYKEESFDVIAHSGGLLSVVSGDGVVSVPLSNVTTVKKIIFVAPVGKVGQVTITKGSEIQNLPFVNYFHYEVPSSTGELIDSIKFSTSEVVKTDFEFRIIG